MSVLGLVALRRAMGMKEILRPMAGIEDIAGGIVIPGIEGAFVAQQAAYHVEALLRQGALGGYNLPPGRRHQLQPRQRQGGQGKRATGGRHGFSQCRSR